MNKRVRKIKKLDKLNLTKILLVALTISIIVLLAFYFNSINVSADNPVTRKKQVISLRIEKGDTLWSIAQEYRTEEYDDLNEYIDEIKSSNGLFTDTIHEGNYIIVPYYKTVDASWLIIVNRMKCYCILSIEWYIIALRWFSI